MFATIYLSLFERQTTNMNSHLHHLTSSFSVRRLFSWLSAVLLLAVGAFFVTSARASDMQEGNVQRLVTIHDNGSEVSIVTRALTIKDAIKQAEIEISVDDIVEPAVSEKLVAKSYQVNIFRARPVAVVDGLFNTRVMTAEQSPKKIAAKAGMTLYDEDLTKFERIDDPLGAGIGLRLTIDRAEVINLSQYGKVYESRTQATTVEELLVEKGIVLGAQDGVDPTLKTAITSGMKIRIWRDGKQMITQEESITKSIDEIKDSDQPLGYRVVRTVGVDGKKNVTYEIEIRGGIEISRKQIASVTTLEPVKEVVAVGSKVLGAYTTPSQNETITWDFLIAQGFTREQTAGIMGNLMQEHGFNTTGDGLAQWTGGRKANLMALPDPYNINTQLQFLMSELNGPYAKVRDAIKASTTVEQAVIIFQNQFERCSVCVESKRIQYAYNILASH